VRRNSGRTLSLKRTPTKNQNRGSSSQVKVEAPDLPGSPKFFSPRRGSPINTTGSQSARSSHRTTGSQSAVSSHKGRRGPVNSYIDLSPQKARLFDAFVSITGAKDEAKDDEIIDLT
jgi:hypothetical protein